jgi:fused signal recognition particle receptor
MFGFLRKQLKKGVEALAKKVEEKEAEPLEKGSQPSEKIKPSAEAKKPKETAKRRKTKPAAELPLSEKPIEVREDEPRQRIGEILEESSAPSELKEEVGEVLGEIEEARKEAISEKERRPSPKKDEGSGLAEDVGGALSPEEPQRKGFFARLRGAVTERTLTAADIDGFFADSETELLQNNVAVEVADFLRRELKEKLVGKPLKRSQAESAITQAFEESIFDAVNQGELDIEERMKEAKKSGKPLLVAVLGFNGSGKTTSIAKIAHYLKARGHGVVLAAGDTFRAASIEQLETHAKKVGVDIVKHKYGADAAAVIFDAVQHAKSRGLDIVLADTAGRTHTDKNLMEELKKVVRVNKPDLRLLVVDSLTGNDAVEQARQFDAAVGVDAVLMTKVDVNEKGGSILSVCYAIRKPILFIGVGQGYDDIRPFKPREFVKGLMED